MITRSQSQSVFVEIFFLYKFKEVPPELTIAKKIAACRFYRDPLRKVDFICPKTYYKSKIFRVSKLARIKYYIHQDVC